MSNIAENFRSLRKSLPEHVRIIAVSKKQQVASMMEAYDAGQRAFGENRAQEMAQKQPLLPRDIEWHFIGHLQTNKIRHIASFVSLIHSVDSLNLLKGINGEALKGDRVIDCLLQFHIATEETKFGLSPDEASELLTSEIYGELKNIRITGVMGMASFTDELELVRQEFKVLHDHFNLLKSRYFETEDSFRILSMGMSGDYRIAVEEGSNMVRIGTSIFGAGTH